MSVLKGTGNVLKTILGGAMEKYPVGTPAALGTAAAAGLGVLGNKDSGYVGRNTARTALDALSKDIEWDNPDIIELDKHFTKVNKLYGSMDTTELPYTLMQNLYNKSGRDVKRSKMALERINKQIEKDPDFKKYGAGDYLTRWYELTENPFENELPMDNQMMPEDFR